MDFKDNERPVLILNFTMHSYNLVTCLNIYYIHQCTSKTTPHFLLSRFVLVTHSNWLCLENVFPGRKFYRLNQKKTIAQGKHGGYMRMGRIIWAVMILHLFCLYEPSKCKDKAIIIFICIVLCQWLISLPGEFIFFCLCPLIEIPEKPKV